MGSVAKVKWPLIFVLAAVGFVFLGQGIGLIGGSFMTGEPLWAIVGAAMLIAAAVLGALTRRRG
jgi:hypothetical protein